MTRLTRASARVSTSSTTPRSSSCSARLERYSSGCPSAPPMTPRYRASVLSSERSSAYAVSGASARRSANDRSARAASAMKYATQ